MSWRLWSLLLLGGIGLLLLSAAWIWRGDILRTALDPRIPYQTYDPPAAPDYARAENWALQPDAGAAGAPDVFFVHPTTYNGGEHWNAPIGDPAADRVLRRDMLPNHAGPYQRIGRVVAPRYRQASLYTLLTLRDDARDARRFAYGDVQAAFRAWRAAAPADRPFLIVGVEQGGLLAARLLAEEVAPDPQLRARFVGAHLTATVTPPIEGLPTCAAPDQFGCVLAYASVAAGDDAFVRRRLDRALTWRGDRLETLHGRAPICVNPLIGQPGAASRSANLGAANATGLDWGSRPAFVRGEVGAACRNGLLHVTRPEAPALRSPRGWAERRRAPPFNLFYADLEADALRRLQAWTRASSRAGAPVGTPIEQLGQQAQ